MLVLKLGSRRQLDFELRDLQTHVLSNLNRLAGTNQDSLPVHDTLDHFLTHVGPEAIANLRKFIIDRLIRMRALDGARLYGFFVIGVDGTGYLLFRKRHCEHCLVQKHENKTYYLHPVLEAKLLDTVGLALSIGSEFIENYPGAGELDYERKKQDCELEAFERATYNIKKSYPQLRICISGDALYACGRGIRICEANGWAYFFTFKPTRLSTLWEDFQGLLKLCPENILHYELPDGVLRIYRWVNGLSYQDSDEQIYSVNAIVCDETVEGKTTTFAWITSFHVTAENVIELSEKGGRIRSKIENEGFNIQKNSGLNMEHAYSFDRQNLKSFYYLLQIAHIILQLLEKGNLLRHIARQVGKTPLKLFGSLKNIARRLLECFRYFVIPECIFDRRIQIRLAPT